MSRPYKKWRDEHVLFLDDSFDCDETHGPLVEAGFIIERFCVHFSDENGARRQGVEDPDVIRLCNKHSWVLITLDSEIVKMHANVIKDSHQIGILATAHGKERDVSVWAKSLVKLKPILERGSFRKRSRPWFGQFDRNGKITVMKTFG